MRLLIEIFIELVLSDGYGMIRAELLESVKAGGEREADKSVLLLDALYLLVLLLLLKIPLMSLEDKPENNSKRRNEARARYYV